MSMWARFSCAFHAARCIEGSDTDVVQIVIRNDGIAGQDRVLVDMG